MSESIHIKDVLLAVMADIERRCRQNPDNRAFGASNHRARVLAAVGDFHKSRKRIPKEQPIAYEGGDNEQFNLWD